MDRFYIPIIGTISAGKSKFLQALLGINVLQSGACTTTKFVCLIKNSQEKKFYHVIPKEDKILTFEKDGEEINGEENIKERIIDINKKLSENKKGTKNDIFYMLEIPIKNIENNSLLDNCYFMDIPGLNENEFSYTDVIFSLITIEKILFEIMVFDSTSIGSDNILNIFKELNKKGCLKLKNNIFVLNKIDLCTQNIIDTFKQYFYETFEDKKEINDKNSIILHINENHFIPINSILYLAETKMNEDFSSFLIFEFFNYLKYNKNYPSFFEYLENKMKLILDNNDFNNDKEIKNYGEKEKEIITKAIEGIKSIESNIQKGTEILIGLNIKKKSVLNEMKKLYFIHKNKKYDIMHSTFYFSIQEFIKNVKLNLSLLSSPPPNIISDEKKINLINNDKYNIENEKKEKSNINNENPKENLKINKSVEKISSIDIEDIEEFEIFLNETFKLIDPMNELKAFQMSFQSLREKFLRRKLRIILIGNIGVEKSKVLNFIIGNNVLPTDESKCINKGIIISNSDSEDFKLYITKLIPKGTGYDEFYYFETQQNPFLVGIEDIKLYLRNKNNDNNISNVDEFYSITGKLKMFDFLGFNDELKNMIELIYLPSSDKKNKEYFKKIIKNANCRIYVNESKTINDEKIAIKYIIDKEKVLPNFQNNFIKTCLFLVNKSDTNIKEEKMISNNLFDNISKVEKEIEKNDINISFVSEKDFKYLLDKYYYYIEILDKNPSLLYDKLYNQYNNNINKFFNNSSFSKYVYEELSNIEKFFKLNKENENEIELQIQEQLRRNIRKSFKNKNGDILFSWKDGEEIIEKLSIINQQLKKKDFLKDIYLNTFLKIKNVLYYSEILQKQNLENYLILFFECADILFNKELEEEILDNNNQYIFIKKELIQKVTELLNNKEYNLKAFIGDGKSESLNLINKELENISDSLREADNDLENASKKLQEKIGKILEDLKDNQQRELESLNDQMKRLIEDYFKEFELRDSSGAKIETNKIIDIKNIISLFSSTNISILIKVGFTFNNKQIINIEKVSKTAGKVIFSSILFATLGFFITPVGPLGGFAIGLFFSLAYYLSKKTRYKEELTKFLEEVNIIFNELEENYLEKFRIYKNEFLKVISEKIEVTLKKIDIDKYKWEEIKKNYLIKKEKIMSKINKI